MFDYLYFHWFCIHIPIVTLKLEVSCFMLRNRSKTQRFCEKRSGVDGWMDAMIHSKLYFLKASMLLTRIPPEIGRYSTLKH